MAAAVTDVILESAWRNPPAAAQYLPDAAGTIVCQESGLDNSML
jgi:hypothetical protein